jgi:hypothetical protein
MSTTKTTSALDAMLKQYETNTINASNSSAKKKYDLKNYFTTHLADGVKTATKTIRILPASDGTSPFIEFFGHKTKVGKDTKVFACLKHEKNQDCPFCEAREALLATGKEQDKETAKKYSARKMFIVKLIDRTPESDNSFPVKFWRFPHDYRKQGIFDKIYGIISSIKKDITDPVTGRDLSVILARDQNNFPIVQTITHMDPSPLSENQTQASEWLADTRTWEDVYSVKSYDYLAIVVGGGIPVWDETENKFVDKNLAVPDETAKLDAELSLGIQNVKLNVTAAVPTTPVKAEPVTSGEEDDDLPF